MNIKDKKAADKVIAAQQAEAALPLAPKPSDVGHMGPSNTKNFAVCPSFLPIPQGVEQDRAAAEEGDLLHLACAQGSYRAMELKEEHAGLVDMMLGYVSEILGEYKDNPELKEFKEIKLPITISEGFTRNGILDLLITCEGTAEIIDYKFGRIEVDDAEQNWQGYWYVIAAAAYDRGLKSFRVHFLQPRCDYLTTAVFTRKDVERLRAAIEEVYLRTQLPPEKRPHNYDPDNCQYCWRKTICPAVLAIAQQVTGMYDPDALPKVHTRPSEVVNPQDFALMFAMARVMEKWAMSVKQHSTQLLLGGQEIDGLKLVEKSGGLYVPPDKVVELYNCLISAGLETADILAACEINWKRAYEIYKDKFPEAAAEVESHVISHGLVQQGQTTFYAAQKR
jgi:hypothetical protein